MKHHEGIRSYDHTAAALAFPLGGIGTGNVSLGARGELRDWEIFNQPAKGNALPLTFFALRCQQAGREAKIRVLEGPLQAPHTPSHGYHPMLSLGGLPRFKGTYFSRAIPLRQHRVSRCQHAGLGVAGSLYALAAAEPGRFRHSLRYPDLHRQQPVR